MKRVTMVMCGVGLMITLGASLFAPPAEAVSSKQLGFPTVCEIAFTIGPTSPGGTFFFFLGEDGGIWYTGTRPNGIPVSGAAYAPTGNTANPFDQAVSGGGGAGCSIITPANCNGFVKEAAINAACIVTGDICAGIYAKVPGPGGFIDSPTVISPTVISRPTVLGTSPNVVCPGSTTIVATGGDNNLWYTLFDCPGSPGPPGLGTATTMNPACPGRDPFFSAAEDKFGGASTGTGFVDRVSLIGACAAQGRTCVGPWVRFP